MSRIKYFLISYTLVFLSISVNAQSAGNSLHLDGVDDYVSLTLPAGFSNIAGGDFTAECWVKPETIIFSRILFAQLDNSNFMSISINNNGEVLFYIQNNGADFSIQSTEAIDVNDWSHVAVIWDAGNTEAKIVINGVESVLAVGFFISSTGTNGQMTIGARTDGAQPFSGEIDEVRIWSEVKEVCEIDIYGRSEIQGDEFGLIVSYSCNQGVGGMDNASESFLMDAGSSSANGTLQNFSLSGTESNFLESPLVIDHFYDDPFVVMSMGDTLLTNYLGTYQWTDCDLNTPIIGETDAVFFPIDYNVQGGEFSVTVTNGTCVNTSECFDFQTFGIDPIDNSKMVISPNPVNDQLNISVLGELSNVEVYDVNGQVVFVLNESINEKITIDVSSWKSGVYFISSSTEVDTSIKRFVKI
ncbi:MAG: T9SS type A sorting domain-containing protein [Crocinitomicaceae bacterium]|nr:T9SS type A sorting domain-containing protein [Crocinitomicaceae bacterium]